MKQLSKRDQLFVGLALFSMFFGAGNLIFPPYIGAQAGAKAVWAMAGFGASAIGFPILGVVAVAKSGGLDVLAGRVHPRFASLFTLLIYLSIGPCLAIPRTASTSFEMIVQPFVEHTGFWMAALYSLLFFAAALLVAMRPEKVTDFLGRVTGPGLLVLIFAIVAGSLFRLPELLGFPEPAGSYGSHQLVYGFLDGYQTMDAIAALNFGIVITLNIRAKGVTDGKSVIASTVRAGWIAGGVLLAVYLSLAYVGALAGKLFPGAENGAVILSRLVSLLFGPAGSVLVGVIFLIACFNTCVGLICCCSEYFSVQFPMFSYRSWAVIFAVSSFLISIAGLNAILKLSVPVLGAIYPAAIVLILLGLLQRHADRIPAVYPAVVSVTAVISVISSLDGAGVFVPVLTALFHRLPFYELSLGWLLPAVLTAAAAVAAALVRRRIGLVKKRP